MTKRLRKGKVLVDWSQNDEHKTTVTVYSVRARERPTVSAPVSWEEVQACLDARDPELLSFETDAGAGAGGRATATCSRCCSAPAAGPAARHEDRMAAMDPISFATACSSPPGCGRRRPASRCRGWPRATRDQIQSFELKLVDRLWESANAENAREIADRTWDLVHDRPDTIRSSCASSSATRRWRG